MNKTNATIKIQYQNQNIQQEKGLYIDDVDRTQQ